MPLLKRSTRAMLFTLLVVACSDDQALDTPDHGVAIDVVTVVPDLHLDSDEGTRLDGVTDSMSDGGAEPAPDSVGDAATGSDSASRSDTGADTSTDVGTPPLFDSSVSSSDAATPTSDNGTDVAIDSGPDNGSDLPLMLGDCTTYCADMAEVCMMEGFHKPEQLIWPVGAGQLNRFLVITTQERPMDLCLR